MSQEVPNEKARELAVKRLANILIGCMVSVALILCGGLLFDKFADPMHPSYEGAKLIHSIKKLDGWRMVRTGSETCLYNDTNLCIGPSGNVYDVQNETEYGCKLACFALDTPFIKEAFKEAIARLSQKARRAKDYEPTEEGITLKVQVLLDSMATGQGWRVGNWRGTICNEAAGIYLTDKGDVASLTQPMNHIFRPNYTEREALIEAFPKAMAVALELKLKNNTFNPFFDTKVIQKAEK